MSKLKTSNINDTVWKACDTFRGVIDPSQYKDYILVMLFIKYISDVNKEKRAQYARQYDGNEERIERAMRAERFIIPPTSSFDYLYEKLVGGMINRSARIARSIRSSLPSYIPPTSSFDYLYENRNEPNIGSLIDVALADLEEANREKLTSDSGSGVFRNISFNSSNLGSEKEKNTRLKQLLNDFNELDLMPSHLANK